MGIRAFIVSRDPPFNDAEHFGNRMIRNLKARSLPYAYGGTNKNHPIETLSYALRVDMDGGTWFSLYTTALATEAP